MAHSATILSAETDVQESKSLSWLRARRPLTPIRTIQCPSRRLVTKPGFPSAHQPWLSRVFSRRPPPTLFQRCLAVHIATASKSCERD